MIRFQRVTIDNALSLTKYLELQPFRTCDYTLGAIFQWRAYFKAAFADIAGMLVLLATYPVEGFCYTYPVGGGDMDAALAAIEHDAGKRGVPLTFCAVPEAGLPVLTRYFGERVSYSTHRDWADYLYHAEDLKTFPGRGYHGQRNHLNRFIKDNPAWRYVPVTGETLCNALDFLDRYAEYMPAHKAIEAEEMLRSRELLAAALTLRQQAGYIDVDGTVVALAVGEVVGDTLYVHVEKARYDYRGAYQIIVSEFAKAACKADTLYINREDDSGEPGLRKSKLDYRPVRLIDKYWVNVT